MNFHNSTFRCKPRVRRWVGRKTLANMKVRAQSLRAKSETSAERKWKRAVRERDDYSCQRCMAVRYQYIHVHHIAPRSRRPDLKLELSNGICLDLKCHMWVHSHPIQATEQGLLSDATYEKARRG